MKNAPRKNAGLSSICGYCKTPLDTLEQTKMATPKRKAGSSNLPGDASAGCWKIFFYRILGTFFYGRLDDIQFLSLT